MFLVIPVEHKPSLRSPPWMTVLLILIHVLIYFGWQVREESAVQRMAQLYAKSTLPALELPQLVEYVGRQAKQKPGERKAETAAHVETAFRNQQYASLYVFMWQERQFRQDLLAERIIRPGDDHYETWRLARRIFNLREPQAFTARWAQDYSLQSVAEVLERPLTLLTSGFLHGSFGHLLGNMIFLFIFGFALEKALGAGRYLAFYLLSGVGASAVAAWAYAGSGSYGLGASGAIAGLMGMYAVQYRMRRIQFFYYILFYFNYARLPALGMLPVWMCHELVQNWLSDDRVAYMAHFGGLVSGALLLAMSGLAWPMRPAGLRKQSLEGSHSSEEAQWSAHVARAHRQADALDFEAASQSWRAAATLRPGNIGVLQSWFEIARHRPESDDFHTSARMLLQLSARDDETRQLQRRIYQTYLAHAKPAIRLRPSDMLRLARTFIALQDLEEAERLCRLLEKRAFAQPELPQLLSLLANAWIKAGHMDRAQAWRPALQRLAPRDPVTVWLAQR